MATSPGGPGSRCRPFPARCGALHWCRRRRRARVLEAAEALSFAVSRAASSLATGKLDRVAVLVSGSLGSWFNGCLLDAIYQTLHDRRQEMLIYRTLDSGQRDEFFATLPARRNADALIVASLELTGGQRQRLQRLDLPVVFVNQRAAGAASVSIDDAAGATVATQHLINLGHRRIAYRRARHTPTARGRARRTGCPGCRAALAAAGVPKRDQMVISVRGREAAEHAVARAAESLRAAHRRAGGVRRSGDARARRAVAGRDPDPRGSVGDRVRRPRDGCHLRSRPPSRSRSISSDRRQPRWL